MSFDFPPLQTPIADEIAMPKLRATQNWLRWFNDLYNLVKALNGGYTGTITTAKLTGGGANGSMTFVNGVLTAQTAAT